MTELERLIAIRDSMAATLALFRADNYALDAGEIVKRNQISFVAMYRTLSHDHAKLDRLVAKGAASRTGPGE